MILQITHEDEILADCGWCIRHTGAVHVRNAKTLQSTDSQLGDVQFL